MAAEEFRKITTVTERFGSAVPCGGKSSNQVRKIETGSKIGSADKLVEKSGVKTVSSAYRVGHLDGNPRRSHGSAAIDHKPTFCAQLHSQNSDRLTEPLDSILHVR